MYKLLHREKNIHININPPLASKKIYLETPIPLMMNEKAAEEQMKPMQEF